MIGEKTEVAAKAVAGSATRKSSSKQAAIDAALDAAQAPVRAVFETGWKVALYAQCRYDGTSAVGTDHGRRTKQQVEWAKAIAAKLPKYPVPYPGIAAKLSAEGC